LLVITTRNDNITFNCQHSQLFTIVQLHKNIRHDPLPTIRYETMTMH